MPHSRVWDEKCPRVWDEWEKDGSRWIIQDLDPQDDDLGVKLILKHFLEDEELCKSLNAHEEEASVAEARRHWAQAFSGRTSLACYRCDADGGNKELVALNACPVRCVDDPPLDARSLKSEKWKLIVEVLVHVDELCNTFKELNVDKFLSGAGLMVVPRWRGRGLGKKLLNAREPLCRALGIPATATVFTAPASQHEAAVCGFATLLTLTRAQLDRAGLRFPVPPEYVVTLMAKKYD